MSRPHYKGLEKWRALRPEERERRISSAIPGLPNPACADHARALWTDSEGNERCNCCWQIVVKAAP
jgi:hypothetical protein